MEQRNEKSIILFQISKIIEEAEKRTIQYNTDRHV